MADEVQDDVMHSVCDPELPYAGDVWGGAVEKSGEWWDPERAFFLDASGGETNNFAGV
jgi:hypothetical protein